MKIAIVTDTHWGVRNDHLAFLDNQKLFLNEVFFPELVSRGITHIVHLGDLVDRRKYINYLTLRRLRQDFLDAVRRFGMTMDILLGNHDVYYKETNAVNALGELLGEYTNIRWYDRAVNVVLGNTKVLYVPWICDENHEHTMRFINETDAQICMGHLDISGFEMYKGVVKDEGLDRSIFRKFDTTFSGHFHHKSESNGIHYLGAMSEQNWSDYNDPRGFHIFDTDSRELEFIQNPYSMFVKLHYSDEEEEYDSVTNKFVKVIVREKNDPVRFEMFIDALEKQSPIHMQIVDDHLNLDLGEDDTIVDEAEDTLSILKKAVNQSNSIGVESKRLNEFIVNLYTEALSVE